jgi:pyruvate kinase
MPRIRSSVFDSTNAARPSRFGIAWRVQDRLANSHLPESVIDNARQAEKVQKGRQVAIALDTKGPEIRTGNTKDDADIPIEAGTIMNFTTDEQYATSCDTQNM